jgi:tagaturonate reductase
VPQDRPALEARVGYVDHSAVEAEPFHLWVIEADEAVQAEFPAPAAGLNLVYAKDLTPYRTRKVRILNGVHTMMTPIVYLGGVDTVGESFDHPVFSAFIKKVIVQEIIPTLDLSLEELNSFAASVEERFRNPYVSHAVLSISLNSVSKYKARVLPSVVRYATEKGALPQGLTYALAALIVFYKGNACDRTYNLSDDAAILTKFETLWHQKTLTLLSAEQLVAEFLSDTEIWDVLPADVEGLVSQTALYVDAILENGILASLPEIQ